MEPIIERLRKVPVCELDGQLRRVRRILPSEKAAAWLIKDVAGYLRLTADVRVCFHGGDSLTQAELSGARQSAPDCWQVRGPDGGVRTLRLFNASPAAACRVTVTQGRWTRQARLMVHQLSTPAETAAPADTAALPDGTDPIASPG
jgi:hypothetical protein